MRRVRTAEGPTASAALHDGAAEADLEISPSGVLPKGEEGDNSKSMRTDAKRLMRSQCVCHRSHPYKTTERNTETNVEFFGCMAFLHTRV